MSRSGPPSAGRPRRSDSRRSDPRTTTGARVPRLAALLPLLAGLLLPAVACTPATPRPTTPDGAAPPPATAPWRLPPADLGTQNLFRVSYEGSDGAGSFRLTLRLEDAGRYRASAVDPLGRALWSLDVAADRGLWIDHRNRVACRVEGDFDLDQARLAPLPLGSLPALLLGRLPVAPAEADGTEPGRPRRSGAGLDFRDPRGRRWTARLEDGAPAAWTLWLGGSPVLWWVRRGDDAFLSDPSRGTQLRWRRTLREELAGELVPAAVPEGFAEAGDCAALYADPAPEPI